MFGMRMSEQHHLRLLRRLAIERLGAAAADTR